jgi:hypothetical protein
MRNVRSVPHRPSEHGGGALALFAICGLVVAVGLMAATVDRLGALAPTQCATAAHTTP